jgi:aspartyl-tRNA(Asn)/glutamyl-tRNA(Gln) amidotransferase subunit A
MIELTRIHAHHMAARLRRGEVSSRELTEAHLDVAERQNDRLNAWLSIDRERALAEADRADARLRDARAAGAAAVAALHPMLGIPVALKDLVSVEGGQCTAGSLILKGYRAPYDAHITERLRDVGAVILGKTNMDEFAMGSSTEHSAYARPPTRGRSIACPADRAGARRPRWLRTTHRSRSARTPVAPSGSRPR